MSVTQTKVVTEVRRRYQNRGQTFGVGYDAATERLRDCGKRGECGRRRTTHETVGQDQGDWTGRRDFSEKLGDPHSGKGLPYAGSLPVVGDSLELGVFSFSCPKPRSVRTQRSNSEPKE